MPRIEGLSGQLVGAVADKFWPQGKPFVKREPNGDITVGRILRREVKKQTYFNDDDALDALKKRRKIVDGCRRYFHGAVKIAPVSVGATTLVGITDRSAGEIFLGGASAALGMGGRIAEEITKKTVENLDQRMKLIRQEQSKLAHQGQPPQS